MYTYQSIGSLINLIDEPNRSICQRVIEKYKDLFFLAPGASDNHQNWDGGYCDHLEEGMNVMVVSYSALQQIRPLSFSLSDGLLTFFLHDIEKMWRYIRISPSKFRVNEDLRSKESRKAFRAKLIREEAFQLSPDIDNALLYVESEGDGYKPNERVMNPLAAFCHCADLTSARIWFDKPSLDERIKVLLTLPQD